MNYMKQVAQMLGVELEEEFLISNTGLICKFIDNGLLVKHITKITWHYDNSMLRCLLSGKYEIVKKPILDDVEKEYLSHIIKPFEEKIMFIRKSEYGEHKEYIDICYCEDEGTKYTIEFPSFKKGTMYKGMELDKQYSLEDLEL